ncbi:HAD family hydrolase [Croceicoccus marinus]|jgi:2-haloacid dehalogenase|uniref:HAD family phosphatase n=1 Tax=Croceicoccus marinus TaxID=450378 RepID=A0A7G6VUS2_9SPHN|nr:HAD family phosphatase [Croceicoccus marinus]QNE05487.1 HAD family phosphatase [Croceicoccus marinus]
MTKTPVRNVAFDVGRVLFRWDMALLFGPLVDDPAELDYVLSHVVTEAWHFEHDAGRDLAELVAERKLLFPRHGAVIDAYATRFLESIPGPVPGSHELVEELDERGVPLFAITNFADEFWARFRPDQPVFDRFRDIVVSGTEKLAKPAPEIFELAARRFGIDPAETLFIDDNDANIAAAQRLGWQVHHFRDAPALRDDLARRGLIDG